ncbi:TSUP family transporter [Moraxella nasibovis]|uniref:TSUP family transporter n=1 Tax=Moraxella nasibovis TaxID=2904120 RepID=UPI00241086C5|nr:TSUP family transporter [Moraxella nasibovis]WFF39103.1 TSUP family transporter [Moraxella nasibovis]
MEITFQLLGILFFVAVLAGFVDAAAGGGGLLTVPALLLTGMNPVAALATNKLQGSAGSLSASLTMIKKGIAHPKTIKTALILAFIGSAVGTILVQLSPPEFLKIAIPFVVGAMGLYTLFSPNLGQYQKPPKISDKAWQNGVVPAIGFYDGYFGPGAGTFFSLSGVVGRGQDLVKATGNAKLLNFATNIASLIFFIIGGQVVWAIGAVMIVGQVIGAYLGSNMVIKGGAKFIRPVIVLMCFAMVVRYVFW